MNPHRQEELDMEMGLDTPMDAMRQTVRIVGERHRDQAWILTDQDVWLPNPHYRGPAVPHPEQD